MAAAQTLPLTALPSQEPSERVTRRQAVDSVLGTMGAEGELPSTKTLQLMEEYVDGRLTMTELVNTIFANARA